MCTILGRRCVPAVPKSRGGNDLHPCHARAFSQRPGRWQVTKFRPALDCPDRVRVTDVVAFRCIAVPRRRQLRDRRVVPVNAPPAGSFRVPPRLSGRCASDSFRRRRRALPAMFAAIAPPARRWCSPENAWRIAGGTWAVARRLPMARTSCDGASAFAGLVRASLYTAVLLELCKTAAAANATTA